jgi:uncharacterized protein HemX
MTDDSKPTPPDAKPDKGHGTVAVIAALLAYLGIALGKFVGFQ